MPVNTLRLEYWSAEPYSKKEIDTNRWSTLDQKRWGLVTLPSCDSEEVFVKDLKKMDPNANHFILFESEAELLKYPKKVIKRDALNVSITNVGVDLTKVLPNDCMDKIFSYLIPQDLAACDRVSKSMHTFVSREDVWKKQCQSLLEGNVTLPEKETWKRFCAIIMCKKYVRLVAKVSNNRIESLIVDVNLGFERIVKSCSFPDWRESDAERSQFIRRNPGYID